MKNQEARDGATQGIQAATASSEGLRIQRREVPFPRDLDGKLEAIFASFNASPKAAVQLILSESVTGRDDLNREFRRLTVGTSLESFHNDTASRYTEDSLCRIGLVAKGVILDLFGHEKVIGYALTRSGKRYGQPAAAKMLEFESQNGFSLSPIFGKTQLSKGDRRAPLTRAKILRFLNGGTKREIDIAVALGVNHELVRSSCVALAEAGAVEFDSIKPQTGEDQVSFELGDIGKLNPKSDVVLTRKIAQICMELAKNGEQITQSSVFSMLPEGRNRSPKSLAINISHALNDLAENQGFLKRGKYRGAETLSVIKLKDKGIVIVEELIEPILNMLANGDQLHEFTANVLPRVKGNLEHYVKETVDLYYPYSKSYAIEDKSNRKRMVMAGLDMGKITAQQLATKLGMNAGTCGKDLQYLIRKGIATRQKINGVFYYNLRKNHKARAIVIGLLQ